jgi:hypothetical protein
VCMCSYRVEPTEHKGYRPRPQTKSKQAETGIWLLKSSEKRQTLAY